MIKLNGDRLESGRESVQVGRNRLTTTLLFALCLNCWIWTNASNIQATGFPERLFAPYVDVLAWPTFSISGAYNDTGHKYYTLAFIVSGGGCTPSWGGVTAASSNWYKSEIDKIRAEGGDVIISFGGANGSELAQSCTDETELQRAYQSVIDRYRLKWIDFDIEGGAVAHAASIDRRNKVIKKLQDANPDLKVAFCLPVLPTGLDNNGLNVIKNAQTNKVRIDLVNVMAMDYGDSTAPDPEGRMGDYAISAATATHNQLQALDIDAKIGITPMIGQNDVASERFYLEDAQDVLDWSEETAQQSWVGLLSMWSMGRDNGNCRERELSPACSGIKQELFDFTKIFTVFGEGVDGNRLPAVAISSPANKTGFAAGATVTITAAASDSDGTIAQVEFFLDTTSLGIDRDAPYSVTTGALTTGTYLLKAVATDNSGATRTSRTIQVFVGNACRADQWEESAVYVAGDVVSYQNRQWKAKWWTSGETPGTSGEWGVWQDMGSCGGDNGNVPPTVRITAPANGVAFDAGENISFTAAAEDSDGTVAKVEFFDNNVSMGADTEAPFAISLSSLAAGTHVLKAVATDNGGATATSAEVQITVSAGGGGECSAYPAWDTAQSWTTYRVGDMRVNGGRLWRCTNTAYSYLEPSSPYGKYGWILVQACN